MKSRLYIWLRAQPLGIRDKAVLSKLCNYANDNTYEADVRVADLAIEVGCCERTIQTTLRHLESIETISTTGRRKRLRSGGLVPIYRVAPDLPSEGAKSASHPKTVLHPKGRSCAHPIKQEGINLSKERSERQGVKSPLPASIRRLFVDYLGESFGTGFLDRCEWDGTKRTLTAYSNWAYERIRFEGWRVLRDLKIPVLKPGV